MYLLIFSTASTASAKSATPSAANSRKPLGRVNQAKAPSSSSGHGSRKRKAAAAAPLQNSTPYSSRARESGLQTPAAPHGNGPSRCPLSAGQIKNKDKRNGSGETPLHKACIKGDLATVVAFIDANADVNTKCNAMWTPLHEVCSHGHIDLVAPLLEARANVNAIGGQGRNCTPLHDAVQNGFADIVEMLLNVGHAKVDVLDIDSKQPKDLADLSETHILQLLELGGSDRGVQAQSRRCKVLNTSDIMDVSGAAADARGPISIVITGVHPKIKEAVEANAKKLGFGVEADLSPSVTHVITTVDAGGMCKRTYKYLCAIVLGKRVVSPDWLAASLRKKEIVSEARFEPQGDAQGKYAAIKGFATKFKGDPPLFDNCEFFFKGDFGNPKVEKLKADKLEKLVRLGGGTMLNREPWEMSKWKALHHAPEKRKFKSPTFIVVGGAKKNQVRENGIHEITSSYLLQCISNFELMDPSMPVARA